MTKNIRAALCGTILGAVCAAGSAKAGAWQHPPFERLTINTLETFAAEGPGRSYARTSVRNYAEMGLPGAFSLGGQMAYVLEESEGATYRNRTSAIGEAEFFGLYHFDREGARVGALKLSGRLVTARLQGRAPLDEQDAGINLGSLHGVSLPFGFFEAETGYLKAFRDDADQVTLDLALGLRRGRAALLLQSFNTKSVFPHEGGVDYDLSQASLSAVLPLRKKLLLEVGARADIASRGLDRGGALFAGFWWTP